jgi:hypothetical protein
MRSNEILPRNYLSALVTQSLSLWHYRFTHPGIHLTVSQKICSEFLLIMILRHAMNDVTDSTTAFATRNQLSVELRYYASSNQSYLYICVIFIIRQSFARNKTGTQFWTLHTRMQNYHKHLKYYTPTVLINSAVYDPSWKANSHSVNKFSAFYGTQRFNSVLLIPVLNQMN